jgi:hypothetical protein
MVRAFLPAPVGAAAIDAVLDLAAPDAPTRAVDVGAGWRVRRSAGLVVVEPIAGSAEHAVGPVPLVVPGEVRLGDHVVRARIDTAPPVAWPDGRSACVLDADVVGGSCTVRPAEAGERFRPIGLAGTTTVLAARAGVGIPVGARTALPVIVAADGTIAWVAGYRGAHSARVTSTTRRYCWMTVERASEAATA